MLPYMSDISETTLHVIDNRVVTKLRLQLELLNSFSWFRGYNGFYLNVAYFKLFEIEPWSFDKSW